MTPFTTDHRLFSFVKGIVFLYLCCLSLFTYARDINVGSKRFTESYILSELIAHTLEDQAHIKVNTREGLGSTGIVFDALKSGEIDIYPEYWGTLTQEILGISETATLQEVNQQLSIFGLEAGVFLGFNNAYALAMPRKISNDLQIKSISDLQKHVNLRLGLSLEFLSRKDGWPGLSKAYHLNDIKPRGIEHGLVYEALSNHQIDLVDAYTTDSRLMSEDLVLLEDDLNFFTSYKSILLYRIDSVKNNNAVLNAINYLQDKISSEAMQRLNSRVELQHENIKTVAVSFYNEHFKSLDPLNQASKRTTPDWTRLLQFFTEYDFFKLTLQHAQLVIFSLMLAILIGIPMGVSIYYCPGLGKPLLYGVSLLQTIPSLALLSFLIALVQSIGFLPAFIALFLYALLPIIEATQSGLRSVDKAVIEASQALGADFWTQLLKIELPLCKSSLYAGIHVAAVWTTGTATIAAFVGAGGYGERIAQGLSTNNTEMMLEGAIPSAVFAILMRKIISIFENFSIEGQK
jgi:osmoprotectant transport system permease protein